VAFPLSDKRASTACDRHATGAERNKVYGTKFALGSVRINGQYGTRMITDFRHIGSDPNSHSSGEGDAIVSMALELRDRTGGGLKGVIADGVLHDMHITPLQRGWLTVVSPPTAASNPGSKDGIRRGPGRKEKDQYRMTATHHDANGLVCEHPIYITAGHPVELRFALDGTLTPVALDVVDYEQRGKKTTGPDGTVTFGPRREYHLVSIRCAIAGDFTARVPLFHADLNHGKPDYKWGEVARVWGVGTPEYTHIYGARNDTESRHTNLKARVKHLPADVPGQELRLLGAALLSNAVALHLHLQANGQANAFDNTC
jgi:hypothetical protein